MKVCHTPPRGEKTPGMAFGYSLSMRVTVLFFGVLKEMLSSERQTLELPQGATVDAVADTTAAYATAA